ncbi:uncharacterized protein EI90DRAFT_318231 [Cantharellus anzutake]|uniref:uncharacterized protein n=1 Tax=Cantharellus anzutake TaxID=1750568 RepID=UPI0019037F76|nr:uncharacterized protein EI90DRAFT_318231 [Cantharellus anzutake]KAF8335336.1 hypothetical protein EI90DRAFT_318231 [Cantharellus anzutake]
MRADKLVKRDKRHQRDSVAKSKTGIGFGKTEPVSRTAPQAEGRQQKSVGGKGANNKPTEDASSGDEEVRRPRRKASQDISQEEISQFLASLDFGLLREDASPGGNEDFNPKREWRKARKDESHTSRTRKSGANVETSAKSTTEIFQKLGRVKMVSYCER